MSRSYSMSVCVNGYQPDREDAITNAANGEWDFTDQSEHESTLCASGDGQLCGGETEEEFTERLSLAIWKANGAFCEVSLEATYLDELPYESYQLDEDAYERLITKEIKS